ncbi:type IVB secretion system protein IcmH/DotU [Enterovibrio sp. ZSDZ35]|uniref:Type IVB secretion system protein IcmH/DotU n=1 Tax=Enterovibrio qingdaonensis TaxID=2899818 RepID=A0ABT5QSL0_9GAMM|nr:type IVB secretion system protein IcmH/DotU [Enterovibrio sp. ZSDZ35]MDD1783967.1 type IVB secretion system protein IcmH/DotU [Enterovibrio sp. ZSDZ35]
MSGLFNEEPTIVIRRQQSELSSSPAQDGSMPELGDSGLLIENLAVYGSPLLNAATELLGTLVTLPRQGEPRDLERFRQQVLDGIANFKRRGLYLDYHPSVIDRSCFVLCAAFDEIILYTEWGQRARWENHSLLSKIFNQRNGGEVFFALLEKACQQPAKLSDFIELQYILIMLGFKGRYRHADPSALHDVKSDVYSILRHYREESRLPVPTTPPLNKHKQPTKPLSISKIVSITALFLVVGYLASEYWYHNRSAVLLSQFSSLDLSDINLAATNQDLVYVSTPEDLGLTPLKPVNSEAESAAKTAINVDWEILLAVFSQSSDVIKLSNALSKSGYDTYSKETDNGIELIMDAGTNLSAIKKLKNELNVRYGLNATIRRAQQ